MKIVCVCVCVCTCKYVWLCWELGRFMWSENPARRNGIWLGLLLWGWVSRWGMIGEGIRRLSSLEEKVRANKKLQKNSDSSTTMVRLSLVAQMTKNLPAMQETWVQFLGLEDPLEKGMAIHCRILAWRTPWIEEPGRLQSMESQCLTWVSD